MSLFETKCPLCDGILWIDPSSLKIVDHRSSAENKDVDAALARFLEESKQSKGWDEKMRKVREEEVKRKAEIEEKFKMAKKEGLNANDISSAKLNSELNWD